jgi:hypothetical protein
MTLRDSIVHKHGDHGWHQHTVAEWQEHQQPIEDEQGPMPMIRGISAQLTDGYHTMAELYDHRRALTALLAAWEANAHGAAWRSKAHHPDDTPIFDGCFIVGINLPSGPITYHYDLADWDDFAAVPEVDHAPKWDGAASWETISRLLAAASETGTKHCPC